MDIKHEEGKKGTFYIEEDGERLAELLYFHSTPAEINIYLTEVNKKLSGQGVGKKLVAEAVGYARREGLTVKATCPFAQGVIEATPEFRDVLPNVV